MVLRFARPGNLLLLVSAIALAGCAGFLSFTAGRSSIMTDLEQQPLSKEQLGKARFVYDDFGHLTEDTLETNALPWILTTAALVMYETRQSDTTADARLLRDIYQRYGFIYPSEIGNWSGGLIDRSKPLGLVTGRISRAVPSLEIEVANFSCASCHAGRLYDGAGDPTDTVWLGLPNSSLDLDAYTDAVFHSLQFAVQNERRLSATIEQMYPDVAEDELRTLLGYLVPLVRERLATLQQRLGRALPFRNGGPGATNGLAALKIRLGLSAADQPMNEPAYVSIPQLGNLSLRSSLLSDGAYYPPENEQFRRFDLTQVSTVHDAALARIAAFFTTPTQGGNPKSAVRAMPAVIETFIFLGAYTTPPFPGTVDTLMAAKGRDVYDKQCTSCHGEYSRNSGLLRLVSFPNAAIPIGQINTDPARSNLASQELLDAVKRSAVGRYVAARRSKAYVAGPLTGLWATAPYLHNGSVPTLWHLMHPEARPVLFEVGGHRLNYDWLGIDGSMQDDGTYRFPVDYSPSSRSAIYNTTMPGKSNSGHEKPFERMQETDKRALMEFLKLL